MHSARTKISEILKNQNSIPFPDFINTALYDPEYGYYAKHTNQVGRNGDFFTSVSVGPLFGKLLAIRCIEWWEKNDKPSPWRILEIGAHNGQLAHDILTSINSLNLEAAQSLEYAITEPLPALRTAQLQTLKNFPQKINIVSSPDQLTPRSGIAFGNEILDALPFHLIKKISDTWHELQLTPDWQLTPFQIHPASELAKAISKIPPNLPDNYQTEIRTNFPQLLRSISSALIDGLILFFDYGFASPEYYDPLRTRGTIRTFSDHKANDNPLENPGEIDITAHVDFTSLAIAASDLSYQPAVFSTQGSYLTNLAKTLIQTNQLTDPKLIANFQTLTHPAHLGARFHAIEFTKNSTTPPQVLHRLAIS